MFVIYKSIKIFHFKTDGKYKLTILILFSPIKKRILSESGEKYVKIKHQVKKKV